MQSGVLLPPALAQCPHIPLRVCVVDPSWPHPENGLIDCSAWKAACITRHSRIQSFRRLLLLSIAAGVLMWESYVDVVVFFIFTTDTITWRKATQRSQVFIPNTFETLCVERVLSGVEAIGVVLSLFGPIWSYYDASQMDAFDSMLTAGSNRSSTYTSWECLTPSITIALLLLLSFTLCFWSCTHWSTCAYSRPD